MPHPIRRPRRVVAMLLLGACAAAVPSVHAGETRTWTDKTGKFRIEAEFVGEEDGVVTLRKEDGDEIEVPLDKLSSADKRAVSEAKAAAEENPFASKAKEKDPFASKKTPLGRHAPHLGGHAVGGEEEDRALGDVLDPGDEPRPRAHEAVDDGRVVDDLVEDVDRGAVDPDRRFQGLDRHVDAGAEAAGAGEHDSHRDGFHAGRGASDEAAGVS